MKAANLILIGYRGTGKSTVARLLGRRLGWKVVSLDREIVRQAGCSIPALVREQGWEAFRELESRIVAEVAQGTRQVLDCGGGVILRAENVTRLKAAGPLVWLVASPPVIIERIKADTQRPALKDGKTFLEEVEEVLAERTPLYAAAADLTVDTGPQSPRETAEEILEYFGF